MWEVARSDWGRDADWGSRPPAPPTELERVARLVVPLDEAFLTLGRYQEEHARVAADLLERETWAIEALLVRSAPIWQQLSWPTLRFPINQPGWQAPYHLELGSFAHLAALDAPSAEEQTLVTAPVPSWARVAPHSGRRQAGHAWALSCSYTPISTAEAVEVLGCRRILAQIEDATRTAGRTLLAETREQAERQASVLAVERMLLVGQDQDVAPEPSRCVRLVDWVLGCIATSSPAGQLLVGACVVGIVLVCSVLLAIM